MKHRIVTIALALSLLAAIFVSLPTKADVDWTGSVKTTDNTGQAKDTFDQGERIYYNVTLQYQGVPTVDWVDVYLLNEWGGAIGAPDTVLTTDYTDGIYNSSAHNNWLGGVTPSGDVGAYYVAVYFGGDLIAMQPLTVKKAALVLDPNPWDWTSMAPPPRVPPEYIYYPGEQVSISLFTTHTAEMFYIQVVNTTWYAEENWTGQIAPQGWWSLSWTIRQNMPDGDYTINVRSSLNHGIWYHDHLVVQKYTLEVTSDRYNYLAGETAKLTYRVYETASNMPYTGVTITYSATWRMMNGNFTWLNGSLVGDSGVQQFLIPADINMTDDVEITYYANETGRSAMVPLTLSLYNLEGSLDIDDATLMPGDTAVVTVSAEVGGSNLPGATVAITVQRNGTPIEVYGASNLTTDLLGETTHTFVLVDVAPQGTYLVTATITKVGHTITLVRTFTVTWDGSIEAKFNQDEYFSGDSAVVSFRAIWNNEVIDTPTIAYTIQIAGGVLQTGNTTGEDVTVAIPADYYGWISVDAYSNLNGYLIDGYDSATVRAAALVLTTDKTDYRGGDTVTWHWEIVTGLSTATLSYEIWDDSDVRVATGTPGYAVSGDFEFTVPTENPSLSYTAVMAMETDAGAFMTAEATVHITANYELMVWVSHSGFASGEFKPGAKIRLHYSINSYLTDDLPVYKLVIGTSWDPVWTNVLVESASGVIDLTLPSDAPSGPLGITAVLYDGVGGGPSLSEDDTMVWVNNNLSGWDRSVAGMAASDFAILVLIIIMMLILIVVPLLNRMKPGKPKAAEIPPPPPAAP